MKALSLIKQCIAETLGEQPLRKNAVVDKDKVCTHPNGFEFSGRTPGTGYKVCRMCGAQQPSDRKRIEKAGFHQLFRTHESTGGSQLALTPTGHSDEWSRPVYKGNDGKIYVDINLGNGTPSIHSVTDEGEPDMPVRNFTIGQASVAPKRTRLCPRCGNSKPELMKQTPEGKMSCTYCHWEENPDEPKLGESISNPSKRRQVGSVYVKSGQYAGKTVYAFEDETTGLYYTTNMDTGTDVCLGNASNVSVQNKPNVNFIKECLAEVMEEDPLYVEYVGQRQGEAPFMMNGQKYEYVNAKYPNGKVDVGVYAFAGDMVYGYNAFRQMMGIKESKTTQLVKECVLEVLKENLCEGGYDPQSQAGPNVPMENPYPEWNSQMAKMEEDNTATAADFSEPQSWKKKGQKVQVTFFKNGKNETQFGVIKEPQTNQAIIKPDVGFNTIVVPWKYVKPLMNAAFGVNETEGRYAQQAGAGQFDPRTFGPVAESAIKWQCPHCQHTDKIPFQTFKGKPSQIQESKKKSLTEINVRYALSIVGPQYIYHGVQEKNGIRYHIFSNPAINIQSTKLLFNKNGQWFSWSSEFPDKTYPLEINSNLLDPPPKPEKLGPPKPPKSWFPKPPESPDDILPELPPKRKTKKSSPSEIKYNWMSAEMKNSGSPELDKYIIQAKLSDEESIVVRLYNKHFSIGAIGKFLGLNKKEVDNILLSAWFALSSQMKGVK